MYSRGAVIGCDIYSPAALEPHHPDLYWYGVHGVEMLFTLMAPGCESVARTHTAASDVVVGRWRDGRLGVYRGMREGDHGYGATVCAGGAPGDAFIWAQQVGPGRE